jgi:hypothetical protein
LLTTSTISIGAGLTGDAGSEVLAGWIYPAGPPAFGAATGLEAVTCLEAGFGAAATFFFNPSFSKIVDRIPIVLSFILINLIRQVSKYGFIHYTLNQKITNFFSIIWGE